MHIPFNRNLIKLDQSSRDKMCNELLKVYSIPSELKPNTTVDYRYRYDNIQVSGRALIIGFKKTREGNKIILYCQNKEVLKLVYNPEILKISVVKYSNKKVRKSKLNHLIKN